LNMFHTASQDGNKFELPLELDCHNPKCEGRYDLTGEFSNDQELWVCSVCRDRWFVWTARARFELTGNPQAINPTRKFASIKEANLAAAGESPLKATDWVNSMYSSEALCKQCLWCRDDFTTYNPEDDLCERCSVTQGMQAFN
jgi:hypothetical protein